VLSDRCINTRILVSSTRLGVRHPHPPRPPAQVVGAGREDVPHQPEAAMDTDEEAGPAEDGGAPKSSEKKREHTFFMASKNIYF